MPEEITMENLKEEHSGLYNSIYALGVEEGMKKERERAVSILKKSEVASIIHKGIYEKDISEEFPVRNLHIYAIAKMICDKQMGGANEIPKM